jgi:nucleotide-binding universal stress UspA family protein
MRIQIQRILCPTDFSEYSTVALEHAVALRGSLGASLEALHVLPFALVPGGDFAYPWPASGTAGPEMLVQSERELRAFVERVAGPDSGIERRILEGDAAREIAAEAERLGAGLIVMGTHGRSGFDRLLLGSVAEKVLRRAPCPVLTVRAPMKASVGAPASFRRILCATDLSASSPLTIDTALSVAEENQADLTLLHVIEGLSDDASARLTLAGASPVRGELERNVRVQLRKAVPDDARAWCRVRERVAVGEAWREILAAAARAKADLIVMGVHGDWPLGPMLFGSTCQHVVREAPCPVLTVRPGGAGRQPMAASRA